VGGFLTLALFIVIEQLRISLSIQGLRTGDLEISGEKVRREST
jgi:hypothetical protein